MIHDLLTCLDASGVYMENRWSRCIDVCHKLLVFTAFGPLK